MLLHKRNLRVMTPKQKVSNPNCSVLGCIRNSYSLDSETGEAFCPAHTLLEDLDPNDPLSARVIGSTPVSRLAWFPESHLHELIEGPAERTTGFFLHAPLTLKLPRYVSLSPTLRHRIEEEMLYGLSDVYLELISFKKESYAKLFAKYNKILGSRLVGVFSFEDLEFLQC